MSASCFSMSPSYEYSGLNSFRIDWLDLLAVQGTLKSLLQHHSLNTISPYEYSGLISFRIDWFDLLAVQGTLKCLLQHHSSKASISLNWLKFMFTESVMLSDHLILRCPFSLCLQSSPASGSFPVSRLFTSGSQSSGASASASVLWMSIQPWCPLGLTGWISLLSKGLSRILSNTTVWKH